MSDSQVYGSNGDQDEPQARWGNGDEQDGQPDRGHPPEASMHLESGVLDDDLPEEEVLIKSPIWLITFGDVSALMLAFFVMLFSMSHLQSEKWDSIISVMATRDEPRVEGKPKPVGERAVTRVSLVPAFPTGYLQRILEEKLAGDPILSSIRMTGLDDQLVLSLPADRIFSDGVSTMGDQGRRALSRLATVFKQFGNRLDIRGHTDPNPPPTGSGFASNWDLSLARALSVARGLSDAGYSEDVTVLALADAQYSHIDRDIPEAERFRLASRVDIVIVPEARGQ